MTLGRIVVRALRCWLALLAICGLMFVAGAGVVAMAGYPPLERPLNCIILGSAVMFAAVIAWAIGSPALEQDE